MAVEPENPAWVRNAHSSPRGITVSYTHLDVYKRQGPVNFYRTDGHSTIVSLTVEDIYRFQTYLESHSTTLMADGQKLTCICID